MLNSLILWERRELPFQVRLYNSCGRVWCRRSTSFADPFAEKLARTFFHLMCESIHYSVIGFLIKNKNYSMSSLSWKMLQGVLNKKRSTPIQNGFLPGPNYFLSLTVHLTELSLHWNQTMLNEWTDTSLRYRHWRMCFERLLQAFARWQHGNLFDIAAQPILEYRWIDSYSQQSLRTQFKVAIVYSIHTQSLSWCSTGLVPNVLPQRDEGSGKPCYQIILWCVWISSNKLNMNQLIMCLFWTETLIWIETRTCNVFLGNCRDRNQYQNQNGRFLRKKQNSITLQKYTLQCIHKYLTLVNLNLIEEKTWKTRINILKKLEM